MKHTLRAFLALSLLAALCLLALVLAGWFALIVYLVVVRDVPARALFFPFLIGLVGLYVVLAVTRVSSRLSRTAPSGSPTRTKAGRPRARSASTVMGRAVRPARSAVSTRASTPRARANGGPRPV